MPWEDHEELKSKSDRSARYKLAYPQGYSKKELDEAMQEMEIGEMETRKQMDEILWTERADIPTSDQVLASLKLIGESTNAASLCRLLVLVGYEKKNASLAIQRAIDDGTLQISDGWKISKPDSFTKDYENEERPFHLWFGLSYCSYLVLPRLLLDYMPKKWQVEMINLLDQIPDNIASKQPDYHVLREGYWLPEHYDSEDENSTVMSYHTTWRNDPWADYRHGNVNQIIGD
jgi:hypothetical protein